MKNLAPALLVGLLSSYAASAEVSIDKLRCEESAGSTANCIISFQGAGEVAAGSVLYMNGIAEIDRASIDGRVFGETGFFFGTPFYARFFPRVYSLPVAVSSATKIRIETWNVSGVSEELGRKTAQIELLPKGAAPQVWLLFLCSVVLKIMALGALAAFVFGFSESPNYDGLSVPRKTSKLVFLLSIVWGFEMTQLPRVLVPTLISSRALFLWHATVEATLICAFTSVLLGLSISDARGLADSKYGGSDRGRLKFFNLAIYLGAISVIWSDPMNSLRGSHSISVAMQTVGALISLFGLFLERFFVRVWTRAISATRIYLAVGTLTCVLLARDSIAYLFFHSASTVYYIPFGFIAFTLAAGVRALSMRALEIESRRFVLEVRKKLQVTTGGSQQLSAIAQMLVDHWQLARVSVTSVRDDEGLLLISKGPRALDVHADPEPLGPILEKVVSSVSTYLGMGEGGGLGTQHIKHPFLAVPVVADGTVKAVVTIMTVDGAIFRRKIARVVEISMGTLAVEVLSALNLTLSEDRERNLRLIASSTSGIVLEKTDSWGRVRNESQTVRRVIISADGVKSTHLDQVSHGSEALWQLTEAYKRELYAGWFAIKEVFELVTKDVRGDDLWLLTPHQFKDPYLVQLGPEKVALLAAHFIDAHARTVAFTPDFRAVGRTGCHVAVGVDDIKVLPLGTQNSIIFDAHGKKMSSLHRIRAAALPGSVLVDMSDSSLALATKDESMFQVRPYSDTVLSDDIFKDLHSLPELMCLVGLIESNRKIREKFEAAEALRLKSPFRKSAA